MKQVLFTLVISMLALVAAAQPKMEFKKLEHNFGDIKEDAGAAKFAYEFTNTGNAPLLINNVNASCGCTSPTWTKEPILPGKTGLIDVAYDPRNRPGSFKKSISVYSNSNPGVVVLYISGNVAPREKTVEEIYPRVMGALRWKNNYMNLGTVKNTEVKTDVLEFINPSNKPVTVAVKNAPKHIKAQLDNATVAPGKTGKLTVEYDARNRDVFGYMNERIELTIDGEGNYTNVVNVSVTIEEDFSKLSATDLGKAPVAEFSAKQFDFGTINSGDKASHSFKITNTGKSDLVLRNVKASCGCTALKYDKLIQPGQSTDLQVNFDSRGKSGRQNKSITVITNDPKNSTVVLRVVGVVNKTAGQ
jgi:hypothetical protein